MAKFSIQAILGVDTSKADKSMAGSASMFAKVGAAAAKAFAVAAAAVAYFAAKSVQEMVKFDKGMKEVFTLLPGVTKSAMGAMEKDTLKLSMQLGIIPEEVVPALYQAISAGVPQSNVFHFMETAGKAAIGGVTTLETAVDGLTTVLNAYGRDTITVTEAADDMFTAVRLGKTTFEQLSANVAQVTPVAKAAGVSFKDVMASVAALTAAGVPTAQAMTQIQRAIISVNAPTTKARELAASLGISFESLQDDMRKPGGILKAFMELKEKTGGSVGKMKELLGRVEGAKAVLSLTADGGKKLGHAIDEMSKNAGAHTTAFSRMTEAWSFGWDKMKARFKVFQIEFGEMLEPILKAIGPVIKEIFQMVEDLPWDEFQMAIGDLGAEITNAFSGEGKRSLEMFVKMGFDFLMLLVKLTSATVKFYKFLADIHAIQVVIEILSDLMSLLGRIADGWGMIASGWGDLVSLITTGNVRVKRSVNDVNQSMQEQDALLKEINREQLRADKKKSIREANIATVEAAKEMSAVKGREELAKFLTYQLGKKISVHEMMRLSESGELAKMEGMQGQSMAMVANALTKLKTTEAAEAKLKVSKGREMLSSMGLTPGMVMAMQKAIGTPDLETFYKVVGSGVYTIPEMLEKTFGKIQAKRIVALGAKYAEQQEFLKELQAKSLAELAKSLGMSEKEMIEEYHAGRIGGPARQIIHRKLAERAEIERKIMGTSKEAIKAEKEREERARKLAEEEARRAKEARGEQEKLWAKMTESQRKAQEAGPGDFQKIIDEQVAKTKGGKEGEAVAQKTAAGVDKVKEAVTDGAQKTVAAVEGVAFPECIALCDETITKLTEGANFIASKYNDPIPVVVVDGELTVEGKKKGGAEPLPFIFPGQTGWKIKEGFKVPLFGAHRGAAMALTHAEKIALGLIKEEEGGQGFQQKTKLLEHLNNIEWYLKNRATDWVRRNTGYTIKDQIWWVRHWVESINESTAAIRTILQGGNLAGRSPIYSDAVVRHLAAIVEAAERNVRQNGAIGGALHIDFQKNNDLLTKILATLKRIEWYNKEYMGRVAANTAHMQMSEFTPIAPISTNKMAGNLKGCYAAVHNIDRNITAIEKRLRGCITNQ